MTEQSTAIRSLVPSEPMIVIPAAPIATLKYQDSSSTAFSQPEGVIVDSPVRRTGVIVREEFESTSVPVSVIL